MMAVNSADDFVNPPELGSMEKEIRKIPQGRFILLPMSDELRGHSTHSLPLVWQDYLRQAAGYVGEIGEQIEFPVSGFQFPAGRTGVVRQTDEQL